MIVCCDLDGVIWRGDDAIPGSAAGVAALRGRGLAGRVPHEQLERGGSSDYVAKLQGVGVDAAPDDVGSSAQAAAALLARRSPGRRVACSPARAPGVVRGARSARAIDVVGSGAGGAVVVGWHREFDFERLTARRRRGARRRCASSRPTSTRPIRSPGGLVPGAGALVAAVATAAGRRPEVAGKPEAATVALVRERFGTTGVVVGDRPSTDGALAGALEWPFALVLSGVAGPGKEEPVPDPAPAFVADDFAQLAPELIAAYAHA